MNRWLIGKLIQGIIAGLILGTIFLLLVTGLKRLIQELPKRTQAPSFHSSLPDESTSGRETRYYFGDQP